MCEDADEYCPVWEERSVRARKAHQCMACSETIEVGDRYHVTESLFDGRWSRWKHCLRCAEMLRAIADKAGGCAAIDPCLACGETWESAFCEPPPPHVAELAFALPGDV